MDSWPSQGYLFIRECNKIDQNLNPALLIPIQFSHFKIIVIKKKKKTCILWKPTKGTRSQFFLRKKIISKDESIKLSERKIAEDNGSVFFFHLKLLYFLIYTLFIYYY